MFRQALEKNESFLEYSVSGEISRRENREIQRETFIAGCLHALNASSADRTAVCLVPGTYE